MADTHEQANRLLRYADSVLKRGRPEERECHIVPALQQGGKHLKQRVIG